MAYAFVRNLKTQGGANLRTLAQITSAQTHAKRQDLAGPSRQRPDADHSQNHFWSLAGEGLDGGGANYVDAFKAHKKAHGVTSERKGAALGMHLLVGVSPEWLAETGSAHDLANPRVQDLIAHARTWAESWMGSGAVWAVRYDTDEHGSGVVDVLASPVRPGGAGKGKPKPQISTNKALTELQEAHGTSTSYAAMQTSWANYAREHLDPVLLRGEPSTERVHLTPEQFKGGLEATQEADRLRQEAQADRAAALLERQEAQRAAQEARTEAERVRAEAEALKSGTAALRAAQEAQEASKAAVAVREATAATREDALTTAQAQLAQAKAAHATQATDLQTAQAQLVADQKTLAITQDWITRGLTNVGAAIWHAEKGSHDQEVRPEDLVTEPKKFAALQAAAPHGRPTQSFKMRFWTLFFSDTGDPSPLPEPFRTAFTKAFDRVDAWAKHIAAKQADLTKALADAHASQDAAKAELKALDGRAAQLVADQETLATTQEWIERGLTNVGIAIEHAEKGHHDRELRPEDLADRPKHFAILQATAPHGRPTWGFQARFWSLSFGNTGDPAPLPEPFRAAFTKAFDRVDAWAKHIATKQADLTKALADAQASQDAAKAELKDMEGRAAKLVTAETSAQAKLAQAETTLSNARSEGAALLAEAKTTLADARTEGAALLAEAERRAKVDWTPEASTIAYAAMLDLHKFEGPKVFGAERYQKFRDGLAVIWARHPDNPNRPLEAPKVSISSSSGLAR